MMIALRECRKSGRKRPTVEDVLRKQLKTWGCRPITLAPLIDALRDAGYSIMDDEEVDREIALAFDAGVAEGQGA